MYLFENLSAWDNDCCELEKMYVPDACAVQLVLYTVDTAAIDARASALLCIKAITCAIEHDRDGILVLPQCGEIR